MLKSTKLFGSVFLLVIMLFSCKKENVNLKEELKIVNLNVSIETGKIYSLDLNAYVNPNDLIIIAKQAITFDASEIVKNELKNIYTFKRSTSQKDGANKENVVLKIYEPRNGAHCEKTEIIINFTII
jgi:hypothetical protein